MAVRTYANLRKISPVKFYRIKKDNIRVWFKGTPEPYTYSYKTAGKQKVEHMKHLAKIGAFLCAYINRNAKYDYEPRKS